LVLLLIVWENIAVAVVGTHAEVLSVGDLPLIHDRFDEQDDILKPKLERAFVGCPTGIAVHSNGTRPFSKGNLAWVKSAAGEGKKMPRTFHGSGHRER
jgi:hypothetical protein